MLDNVHNEAMGRGVYSVKEAAAKMGISGSQCRRLLERGRISGRKLGHDWAVFSLDYKRQRAPKGSKKMNNSSERK
jgi:excisionase family DNA binding protein